ncbi:MAG: hypothetical protein C4326_13915 [Ignavibacteria bacterium]
MTKHLRAVATLIVTAMVVLSAHAQEAVLVVEDSVTSKAVNAIMRLNVLLPPGYPASHERYPTLYLLHGFGGDQSDWVKRSGLVKYLRHEQWIVVCPAAHNSWYANSADGKRLYEDYILNELIPHVERKYRTLGTRHGRFIAGLSMGGYGALKLALKYPSRFIFAGSFSGALYVPVGFRADNKEISESLAAAFGSEKSAHWTRNDLAALLDSTANVGSLPYLYIAVGKDDAFERIVESNRRIVERLQQRGVLYEYHETPGGHTWQYWDKELRPFLQRLRAFDPLSP